MADPAAPRRGRLRRDIVGDRRRGAIIDLLTTQTSNISVSDLAEKFMGHANIHIDTGSARSSDMSYTRQADIYLGDASSQVYEFLLTPRPCIFLNSHDAKWQGNPDYGHWALGEVLGDVAELPAALDRAVAAPDAYRAVQEAAVNDTFALSDIPSSRRAAQAIAAFLARP